MKVQIINVEREEYTDNQNKAAEAHYLNALTVDGELVKLRIEDSIYRKLRDVPSMSTGELVVGFFKTSFRHILRIEDVRVMAAAKS